MEIGRYLSDTSRRDSQARGPDLFSEAQQEGRTTAFLVC